MPAMDMGRSGKGKGRDQEDRSHNPVSMPSEGPHTWLLPHLSHSANMGRWTVVGQFEKHAFRAFEA
ncbi:hypothetical protein Maq22A_1p35325 (plasmid) [Methylobacterium aquaticum]|uniref:Uncharacterized protein n=1 Tax=Methylobacterium aquaticum TaxID=270351 RepID=A0A0C6FLR3_9HYPH|nr:hypothetical protein Maq22A_1p35325 [Methylobacterium aquaticum]